ncbi:MAG: hypothetical protein PUC97_09680 [bacterium]|nr:hypothetical protein [bacterium]
MRFYIAGGTDNTQRIQEINEALSRNGHIITSPDAAGTDYDALFESAYKKVFSVTDADFVLLLLPGSFETHVELGLALASRNNKRIVLWSETGEEYAEGENACAFYHHTAVERRSGSFEELLEMLLAL